MGEDQITASALTWLRETDTLELDTLKRAYWERFGITHHGYGTVRITNTSYADADLADHTHDVGVNQHGIVHHCTCGCFKYQNKVCKHMVATAMAIDAGELDLAQLGCKEDVIERATPKV